MGLKRKFDYQEFEDNYGFVFDAEKYTEDEALEITQIEYGYRWGMHEEPNITEIYIKWKPKMSKEDMFYYDISDNRDNHGIYQVCDKNDKKSFKAWRVFKVI